MPVMDAIERGQRAEWEKVLPLLQKLEAGEQVTAEEQAWLGSLRYISLYSRDDTRITDVHLRQLVNVCPNVETLFLINQESLDLSLLKGLGGLITLTLAGDAEIDLSPLAELKELRILNLLCPSVSDLSPLAELKGLEFLGLNCPSVSGLSPLVELKGLEFLGLNCPSVSDLSPLAELKELRILNLLCPSVTDLSPLRDLTELRRLLLGGLHLDTLPRFCVREDLRLDLPETTLSCQPEALFRLPTRQILSTYYDVPRVKINEGKVIFLGNEDVGKTHTIQRIRAHGEKREFNTKSTPGVDIQTFDCGDGTQIRFWDFGGQEIMHSMHHCFLTERTCYVVVVNNRSAESPMAQAQKWLRTVAGFSEQVSVLLLVNQWENVTPSMDIDGDALRQICPALSDVVYYSALEDTQKAFIERVTQRIQREVARLDSIKLELPQSWADIRTELLGMKKSHITWNTYLSICRRHGLGGRDKEIASIRMWLLEWLNDMGVCFSYHKNAPERATALKEYKVLQPKWLTEGLYRIINNGKLVTTSGRVSHKDLCSILRLENPHFLAVDKRISFRETDERFVLEVMRKLGRSFQYSEEKEFIPELLSEIRSEFAEPRREEFAPPVTVSLKLAYLPLGLVHQIMLDLFDYVDGVLWLRGVRLRDGDTVVLVEGESSAPVVRFRVYRRREQQNDGCLLFMRAWRLAKRYIRDKRLVLDCEEIRIEKGEAVAEHPVDMVLQAWERAEDSPLQCRARTYETVPASAMLYPLFPRELLDSLRRRDLLAGEWSQAESGAALTAAAAVYPYTTDETVRTLLKERRELLAAYPSVERDNLSPQVLLAMIWRRDEGFARWLEAKGTLRPEWKNGKAKTESEGGTVPIKLEIRGINHNLFLWSENSPLYKMAVGSADSDHKLMYQALGPNEHSRYVGSFALMQAIWSSHPELGLAPDYELLAENEFSGAYYPRYRDHTTHMFKVFLLGLYLYEKSKTIREAVRKKLPTQEAFLSVWILTALYHDIGYVIETEEGYWDGENGKKVLERYNERLATPIAHLFPDVIDRTEEKVAQEEKRLQIPKANQQSLEEKLELFQGIGPDIRLSASENTNPIRGYYEYASALQSDRTFYDHGIVSACMLLFTCDALCEYMQEAKAMGLYSKQKEKVEFFLDHADEYKAYSQMAATAIALHNLQKNWTEEKRTAMRQDREKVTIGSFCIPQREYPIAYLLRLCDEMQCWDRMSYRSPLGKTRNSLDQDKLALSNRLDEVNFEVKDEAAIESLKDALDGILEPSPWNYLYIVP